MNKYYEGTRIKDTIERLMSDIEDCYLDLNFIFREKDYLKNHFSGKDRDALRVLKSSLDTIIKQKSAIKNIEFCTDASLKEKCIKLLTSKGYKYEESESGYSLEFWKTVSGINIGFYLELFEPDDEFAGQLGLEINDGRSWTQYMLHTDDLSSALTKVESTIKKYGKELKSKMLYKALDKYTKSITDTDDKESFERVNGNYKLKK